MTLYVGLMSGTSMNAVDAALLDVADGGGLRLVGAISREIPARLRADLEEVVTGGDPAAHTVWRLDAELGECFAAVVLELLDRCGVDAEAIRAIGSHGQTVFHDPDARPPVTVQLGDPNVIAERTHVTTVADFRRRDLAAGGQGAPLACAFHRAAFGGAGTDRAVVNLGGIANVSVIPADPAGPVLGFDTGPANTLLDAWSRRHLDAPMDRDGAWAARGQVDEELLGLLLEDPYFDRAPPKSTGREHFHAAWLDDRLARHGAAIPAVDVQRTLCELTAESVARAVRGHAPGADGVFVCGGGARNATLLAALAGRIAPTGVHSTETLGLAPEWVEAAAFAWLAARALEGAPGNVPSVTGARGERTLGGIYRA